jgi:hypothetical protein
MTQIEQSIGTKLQERSFEMRKKVFFSRLALRTLQALRFHAGFGRLWERDSVGRRAWGNVTGHCLVEAARVSVLADKLGLSNTAKRELELGAALHDFNKRSEITEMKRACLSSETETEAVNRSDREGSQALEQAGVNPRIIGIIHSIAGKPPTLLTISLILSKSELSEYDIECLIAHYVDGYTRGSEWVEKSAAREDGTVVNEVDRRMEQNHKNPGYRRWNEEQVAFFDELPLFKGRDSAANEGLLCHMIERRLAELIAGRTGEAIDGIRLPELIDEEIKKTIDGLR